MIDTLDDHRVVTLIGNAKNAGKTTVLNSLIIAQKGEIIAVTSIGLDGEELDQINHLPKPRITLYPGMLVATASGCLASAHAAYEWVETTPYSTPLGVVVIVRVLESGTFLIAGPSDVMQMTALTERLKDLGAKRIYIDGAFARQQFARVGDACILVVGANHAPQIDRVVTHAVHTIKILQIPGVPESFPPIPLREHISVLTERGVEELPWHSTIDFPSEALNQIGEDALALIIPKAVVESFVMAWLKHKPALQIPWIVPSPTHLLVGERTLERLLRSHQPIYAVHPLHLVAVCVNPYSPNGYSFDAIRFSASLAERTALPIFNVLSPR